MIENLNFGEFIYEIFGIFVTFFKALYELLSVSFTIPSFVTNIISQIFPSLQIPTTITLIGLLSVVGIPIAVAIGIYFILKGPI